MFIVKKNVLLELDCGDIISLREDIDIFGMVQ